MKKWTTLNINGVTFEYNTKDTVNNPVIFYKSVYDVYGRCSDTKKRIWEDWASYFNNLNCHMYGVTSHNCNFFSIAARFTWIDENNQPVEYYAEITASHNRLWRVA